MAEMYNLGDSDKNEKLEKAEFIRVMITIILMINDIRIELIISYHL